MSKKNIEEFLASEIENDNAENSAKEIATEKENKNSKIKDILHSRKFARGWLFAAVVAVFLACVIAVNIIASVLESKFPSLAFDITSSNMYQLQEDTEKLCKNVDKDITIYLLLEENTFTSYDDYFDVAYFTQANRFFKEIAALNSHITFKYKDVSSDPSFTTRYSDLNFSEAGAVCIVDAGDNNYKGLSMEDLFAFQIDQDTYTTNITKSNVEQAVCTALLALTQTNPVNACFVTSSGITAEKDSQSGQSIYSGLKTLLKNQAYSVSDVDLDSNKDIPKDTDIVFFIGPSKDISEESLEKVNNFLGTAKKKSKTFVYVPSPYLVENGTPNLDAFLEEQGMKITDNWIYEQDNSYLTSMYPNQHTISIFDYSNDTFTTGIDISTKVVMGDVKPISFTDNSTALTLLDSSDKADIIPLTAQSEEEVQDGGGKPLCGVAINRSEVSEGINKNVVVIGSYYAISDTFLNGYTQYNNANYFVNLCNVLTENEGETITITSATASSTDLGLEAATDATIPSVIFLGIVPIGVLVLGIVIWAIRRKK
ncbi:MAG: Gldg family protein [Oscillospiraceae bacterium]|nr:Gldg family protein [Oscillospiraceae bacterium]